MKQNTGQNTPNAVQYIVTFNNKHLILRIVWTTVLKIKVGSVSGQTTLVDVSSYSQRLFA